jgi:hypothetical protein
MPMVTLVSVTPTSAAFVAPSHPISATSAALRINLIFASPLDFSVVTRIQRSSMGAKADTGLTPGVKWRRN